MNISLKQLKELKACEAGIKWFKNQKKRKVRLVVEVLLKNNKVSYANWLLSRLMTHPQRVLWAIYSAEQVLDIFEKRYPGDVRPRKAIEAAKDFLSGKIAYTTYATYAAANAAANAADATYAAYAARKSIEKKTSDYALNLLGE